MERAIGLGMGVVYVLGGTGMWYTLGGGICVLYQMLFTVLTRATIGSWYLLCTVPSQLIMHASELCVITIRTCGKLRP